MKAKVLIPFRDKETKKNYDKKGAIIDVTAKRFNEINTQGAFLAAVEEEKPVKA